MSLTLPPSVRFTPAADATPVALMPYSNMSPPDATVEPITSRSPLASMSIALMSLIAAATSSTILPTTVKPVTLPSTSRSIVPSSNTPALLFTAYSKPASVTVTAWISKSAPRSPLSATRSAVSIARTLPLASTVRPRRESDAFDIEPTFTVGLWLYKLATPWSTSPPSKSMPVSVRFAAA